MPSSDGSSADVEISYTMSGAVMLWQDTAELYWKFVGDGWGEDSNDVTLNVSFDASLVQQNPATVGDTLRAWGHGPLTATVTPNDEDGEVDFDVPCVRAGEFAEARIAFPASWVPYMPSGSRSDEERLPDILDEEKQWAEEANARRERARLLSYGLAALTVVVSVALLAVNNPIGVIFTGCFMSMLDISGLQLTNLTAYNEYITDVIIATIVYLSAFSLVIKMFISGRKKRKAKASLAAASDSGGAETPPTGTKPEKGGEGA